MARRRRRNWSDDEKRMICAQTRVRGVSVSQVARRYDVNANQVFNWLKEPRFADAEPPEPEPVLLPVEISEARDMTVLRDSPDPATDAPKGKPKRKPLPDHLPRNDAVLSPGDICGSMDGHFKLTYQGKPLAI